MAELDRDTTISGSDNESKRRLLLYGDSLKNNPLVVSISSAIGTKSKMVVFSSQSYKTKPDNLDCSRGYRE